MASDVFALLALPLADEELTLMYAAALPWAGQALALGLDAVGRMVETTCTSWASVVAGL